MIKLLYLVLFLLFNYSCKKGDDIFYNKISPNEDLIYETFSGLKNKFINQKFPDLELVSLSNDTTFISNIENGLVLVLSEKSECQKCQILEIDLLNQYRATENSILRNSVIGLYHGEYRSEALKYYSVFNISFPFYYGSNYSLNEFIELSIYPIMFHVKNGVVVDIHLTDLRQKENSEQFIKKVISDILFSKMIPSN